MSLTKEDLEQIKAVVVEVVEPRFAAHGQRLNALDSKIDNAVETIVSGVNEQFEKITILIDGIHQELSEIKDDVVVVKDYAKDHGFRIAKLEHRSAS